MTPFTYRGHNDKVFTVAWSPAGDRVASGCRDGQVHLLSPHTGTQQAILNAHPSCVLSLAWSPDGSLLASGDTSGLVILQEPESARVVCTYHGHSRFVRALGWSGSRLASGGDFGDSSVQLWEARTGQQQWIAKDQYRIFSLAWSPDGDLLAAASFDGLIVVRSALSGEPVVTYRGHQGPVYAVAWSPAANLIASAGQDATIQLWEATTGKQRYILREHTAPIKALAWSPDGRLLASAGNMKRLLIYSCEDWSISFSVPISAWIRSLSWAPTGDAIALTYDALVALLPVKKDHPPG
ncbi:hypothetical protein EI42_04120 [Thermosporothrix hazakensis]|jgi:WD40 repeat protein|uniref:Uncharacterized protein n=2 Tax=Thermosporothrix TaxID=768650 RepID=A0A326U3Z3_THEHA|nr:WD40 repeat domain-containing protein [Thermosporothrix hazakensis]PZW25627.1 hypothetical protein EI42_04120 [Thermosporothrix hazakensis]BBH89922.1 hypothetical protein KTC_46730 [Thermosporothrix sp. COM3]GCE48122.1 hypothetical protein KTH_29910 [Thermosporothrix hazakensis]